MTPPHPRSDSPPTEDDARFAAFVGTSPRTPKRSRCSYLITVLVVLAVWSAFVVVWMVS